MKFQPKVVVHEAVTVGAGYYNCYMSECDICLSKSNFDRGGGNLKFRPKVVVHEALGSDRGCRAARSSLGKPSAGSPTPFTFHRFFSFFTFH